MAICDMNRPRAERQNNKTKTASLGCHKVKLHFRMTSIEWKVFAATQYGKQYLRNCKIQSCAKYPIILIFSNPLLNSSLSLKRKFYRKLIPPYLHPKDKTFWHDISLSVRTINGWMSKEYKLCFKMKPVNELSNIMYIDKLDKSSFNFL